VRAVLQRVTEACVSTDGAEIARIGAGLLALVGVGGDDTEQDADYMAGKIAAMRIFEDADGRMNLSAGDIGGSILLVSQFTLYGDCRKGRRPSFTSAADPARAEALYERLAEGIRSRGLAVETGRFQAMMQVALVNDGPVTLLLDSAKRF